MGDGTIFGHLQLQFQIEFLGPQSEKQMSKIGN